MNPGAVIVDGALWVAIPVAILAGLVSFVSPPGPPGTPGRRSSARWAGHTALSSPICCGMPGQ